MYVLQLIYVIGTYSSDIRISNNLPVRDEVAEFYGGVTDLM